MKSIRVPKDWRKFQPKGDCLLIRYGAIGDMLQMSSVAKALHDQGMRVTLNTTTPGLSVVKNDPYISSAILQEKDQIPQTELREYWTHIGRGFNKVVNLSESAERSLLSFAGDRSWSWSKEFRDLLLSVDYLAAQHAVAGISAPPTPRFYATKEERDWAWSYKKRLGPPVIAWALSGSSVHKAYPYTDAVIASLMLETNVKVVFVGDELCQILEGGWANEPRVICQSGKWSVRQSLAFAQVADIIVGPETGILNGVSHEPVPKVFMLSHSSKSNFLSWVNTTMLTPEECECFPCHKLHFGWATCNRDDTTGAAKCAANISPDRVLEAIRTAL